MEPFIAQIVMFGGTFAPRGWAFCDGQLLAISQNSALFSILGTTYGGDGRTTFGLPELRGRVAIHSGSGSGPGLPGYPLGQKGGNQQSLLSEAHLPSHTHSAALQVTNQVGNERQPGGRVIATANDGENNFASGVAAADLVNNPVVVGQSGGNQGFSNMPPYLAVNYIIALVGIFPSRN